MLENNYLDYRIDNMLCSKIVDLRQAIKVDFENRHGGLWPELSQQVIAKNIRDLRVWIRLAERLDAYDTILLAKKMSK